MTADGPLDCLRACAASLGTTVSSRLYQVGTDEQCFAAPRELDADYPSLRQALEEPDARAWELAIERELANLRNHEAIDPVLEDALPSWDPVRHRASEVVNLLVILKRKYIDNVFDKCKARVVYDGCMQKHTVYNSTGSVLDTFAPAARHTTHKLLVAHATQLGANATTLSSRAYIERIVAKYLPKPLASYPTYSTPSDAKLLQHYRDALDRRHDIDPALACY